MRESALFGTMFCLGAGAVLVGVTVSRLVVGQAADKAVEAPLAAVVETAPSVVVDRAPPAAVAPSVPTPKSSVAPPPAGMAMAGQHRPVPRKHRRPPVEEAAPKTAPVVKDVAPAPSIATRESPPAAPPPAEKAAPKAAPVVKDTAPSASIANRETPPAAPPPAEEAVPKTAPVVEDVSSTASVANRVAPTAAPPRAEATDAAMARHAPIAIVRGGAVRPDASGPGARIIQVGPQNP